MIDSKNDCKPCGVEIIPCSLSREKAKIDTLRSEDTEILE
jgi:hypothetical protein